MFREATVISDLDSPEEVQCSFREQVVIGRRVPLRPGMGDRLSLDDATVSGRHCVVRQDDRGRFWIRDGSRNGTRVDGRRLVPNVEVEFSPDSVIEVGRHQIVLRLDSEADADTSFPTVNQTMVVMEAAQEICVLVGDIRNYTSLTEELGGSTIYPSMERVFGQLGATIESYGGTIKEIQGDAVFAFWEASRDGSEDHIYRACSCAVELRERVPQLAVDREVWQIESAPLELDWAITTGDALISKLGQQMAVVGDCVNYAFRLEKLADEETGNVVVCSRTAARARALFEFQSLGSHSVKGRRAAEEVFVLVQGRGTVEGTLPK